jgi:hypothetical protein
MITEGILLNLLIGMGTLPDYGLSIYGKEIHHSWTWDGQSV